MNKCFSKIWNASLGQVVVASELASGDSVTTARSHVRNRAVLGATAASALSLTLMASAFVVGTVLPAANAYAARVVCVDATTGAVVPSQVAADGSIACGNGATAVGANSIAVGTNASAPTTSSVAIGHGAVTKLGSHATFNNASVMGGVAIGYQATAAGTEVAIGPRAGYNSTPAAGVVTTDWNSDSVFVGQYAGFNAKVYYGTYLGQEAGRDSDGQHQTAVGQNALRYTTGAGYNTALGSNALSGLSLAAAKAVGYSTAIGTFAGSDTTGNYNSLLGYRSGRLLTGDDNVAIGSFVNNGATVNRTTAVGNFARTRFDGDVALGYLSQTAATVNTTSATVNGITYGGFAGTNASSTVSIGDVGAERTLTNVAAGRIIPTSTDAINGSQLYMTNAALGTLATNIGPQAVNNINNGTAPVYNIVNAAGDVYATGNNIEGSIANLNNYVNQGWTVQGNGADVNKVTPGSKVNFVNGNGTTAVVTDAGNGVTNVTFEVSAQGTVNNAQLPVVYTTADGTKVYLQPDGSFNTSADGSGTTVAPADVIASMNNGDDSSTTPMVLNNVAPGDLSATSTQAVNGSQINVLGTSIANNFGGGSTFDPVTGTVTPPSYTVIAGNPSTGATTTVNNIGDALTNLSTAVQQPITFAGDSGTDVTRQLGSTLNIKGGATGTLSTGNIGVVANGTDQLDIQLAKDVKGLDSIEAGGTIVNNNGVTTSNGNVYGNNLTLVGGTTIDMGGNKVTNIAAGTDGTDAVNVNQMNQAVAAAKSTVSAGDNIVVTPTVNADGSTNYEVATARDVNFDNVTVGGVTINGTTNVISGVAPGEVSATSTDAVNGSQLHQTKAIVNNLGDTIAGGLGGGSTYDPATGQVTTVLNVGGTTYNNVNDAINAAGGSWNLTANGANGSNVGRDETVDLNNKDGNIVITKTAASNDVTFGLSKNITVDSVKAGNTTVNNNGLTIAGGPSVTTAGINAGGKVITNVAAGVADTDAVNVSQLNKGLANAVTTANSYTDARVAQIQGDVWNLTGRVNELEDNMHAGVATAMALKQAPYVPGKTTYFAGAAAYKSQGAVGVSLRRTADNGRWSLEGGFSSNKDGTGVFVGVSGVLGGD